MWTPPRPPFIPPIIWTIMMGAGAGAFLSLILLNGSSVLIVASVGGLIGATIGMLIEFKKQL